MVEQAYAIVGDPCTITCVIDAAEEPDSVTWTYGGAVWSAVSFLEIKLHQISNILWHFGNVKLPLKINFL